MNKTVNQDIFTAQLFDLLTETFETHSGIYLDKGTSLFETLDTISAQEASQPVGGKCAALSAQVTHVIFYLEVLEKYIYNLPNGEIDWGEIWRTVEKVTPEEWMDLKSKLHQTYQRVFNGFRSMETWNDEKAIGGALAIVVHTAYHLGEIRQALCTLK